MIRSLRASTALAAILLLTASGPSQASIFHPFRSAKPAPEAKQQPAAKPGSVAWPQAHSDVPADPAIRFGVMPNGMRFAIQRGLVSLD